MLGATRNPTIALIVTGFVVAACALLWWSSDLPEALISEGGSEASGPPPTKIVGLLAGEHLVRVHHPLCENAEFPVAARSGAVSLPTIPLTPLPCVSGVVFDPTNTPVKGAWIEVRGSGDAIGYRGGEVEGDIRPSRWRERSTRTNAEGAFTVALPLGTRFTLKISPPGDRKDVAQLEVELPSERRDHSGLRFDLPDARAVGGAVAGIVLDAGDFGVDAVSVGPFDPRRLDSRGEAVLCDDGRYEVLALKPGRHLVTAKSGRQVVAAKVVDVRIGEVTACDLTTGSATLVVRVIARGSGGPVPQAAIKIAKILGARTGSEYGDEHRVDSSGEFRQTIPSGLLYRVFVGESDDEARAIEEFTALSGQTHEFVLTVDAEAG